MNSFNELKVWLGINDNIKLYERPERGLYSTINIKTNKEIIKIKPKYLIEYQQIYKKYPIDEIEEVNSLVAFYLLKLYIDQDEYWSNYLNTFPLDLSEHVYYWKKSKLAQLSNTSLMANGFYNINKHFECLKNDFEIIYEYNELHQIINLPYDEFYNLYIKFRIIVGSRIFGYKKRGKETNGMIPYVDMVNHSFDCNTTWYWDNDKNLFILKATKDIPMGSEIVDDYGDKLNIDFLLFYGFTISNTQFPILRFNINQINIELNLLDGYQKYLDNQDLIKK